jgi:TPR repeat protein
MSDPSSGNLEPDPADGQADAEGAEVSLDLLTGLLPKNAAQPACPRCQTSLAHVAASARYCPRCGLNLCPPSGVPPVPVVPLLPSEEFARTAHARVEDWIRLREQLDAEVTTVPGSNALAPTPPISPGSRSLIVLGYSNAMYRLGWRYETGNGTGRNTDEALRCYCKAARLGNPAALARMALKGGEDEVSPSPLPPQA